jgi:hypothetical protein
MIQAGGEILRSKIHKLILFGIRKNCVIRERSLLVSLYQFTRRVILGDHPCVFDVTDELLISFLHLSDTGEKKNGSTMTVYQLFVDFKKPMIQLGGKYCTILVFS